jgi:thioredoxin-related protein
MRIYPIILLITVLFICSSSTYKPEAKEKITWMTVEEVQQKFKDNPKPIIIDLYTDWCYWCKVMDKKTYNNQNVISYINKHFYAVKINAETRETIVWGNKNYFYNPQNKINDFALYITNGDLGFPTTVIFSQIENPPAPIPGYMAPKEMESILKYFGDGFYKTQNYMEFAKTFKKTW